MKARMKRWCILCIAALVTPVAVAAEDLSKVNLQLERLQKLVTDLQKQVQGQQRQIDQLQQENQDLKASSDPSRGGIGNAPPVARESPLAASGPVGSGAFLPDIGAVADIVAQSSESSEDEEGNDRVSVREFELTLGHDVDPFTRLDATITFSDFEDPSLEEAYATLLALPGDTKGRFGRFRPVVGKAVATHRDSLDTVDEPLVVQRYFGLEGFSKSGAELSGFIPWDTEMFTQQLWVGVVEGGNGEDGALFGETRRAPTFVARSAQFFDLSDRTNLEVGGSYLLGSMDEDSSPEVNVFGIDATVAHYVTPRNKLKLQSEFYFQDRDETVGTDEEGEPAVYESDSFGFYALADYRFTQRWALGSRYDRVEPILVNEEATENYEEAFTGYLTFHQSEFARWRLQYQYLEELDGNNDNLFWLQGTFAIGTHKHQLQ